MQDSRQWELFGYDIRHLGGYWRAAWREFLWNTDSPVLARLDEVVRVFRDGQPRAYFAGRPAGPGDDGGARCEAVLLPEQIVLSRALVLPVAVEADLAAVMAHQLAANCPFPAQDRVAGWRLTGRDEQHLRVALAIASSSAVMDYLDRQYDCRDREAYEIWAEVDGGAVVLEGFGEGRRRDRYRGRLRKIAGLLGVCAVLVTAMVALEAGVRHVQLEQYRTRSEALAADAGEAMQARNALLAAGGTIAAVNSYLAAYPSPHRELARLSAALGDDVSLVSLEMNGRDIKLRGRARNAAAVMQQLSADPAYAAVVAPQAITRLGDTGLEQFFLDLTLAGDAL